MQPTFSEIKKAAKSALKHRWPEAIAVSCILIVTSLLNTYMQYILMSLFKVGQSWSPFNMAQISVYSQPASIGITVFSALYGVFITLPLILGVMRWFWQVTAGSSASVGEIFCYFSSTKVYFKTLLLSLRLLLRLLIGTVVWFLPFNIVIVLTSPDLYNMLGVAMPMAMEVLYPLLDFLIVLGFALLLFWSTVYILCYTVAFSEGELSVGKIIRHTAKLSKGFRLNTVGFILSFSGWLLLSVLAVPIIFTLPYLLASLCVYGREVYRASRHSEQSAL